MAVIVVIEVPGGTQAQYEAISDQLTGGNGLVKSLADMPAPGLISHAAGPTEDGWIVTDVWESAEAFAKFGETMLPLSAAAGLPDFQPRVYPVFHSVS